MKWNRVAAGLAAASTLGFGAAHATVLGIDFTGAPNTNTSVWDLGYEFQAKRDADVVGLGYWDDGSATQDQQASLWDVSGNLLASVFVPTSAPSVGDGAGDGWKFASITPVHLVAGDTYYVASQGGADFAYGVTGVTYSSAITYIQDAVGYANGPQNDPLVFPGYSNQNAFGTGNFGGNIELAGIAAPEPATWAMLILGLFATGGLLRSRRAPALA